MATWLENSASALIAAVPASLALFATWWQGTRAGAQRSRTLSEAERLVDFVKKWSETSVAAGIELDQAQRGEVRAIMQHASEMVQGVVDESHSSMRPRSEVQERLAAAPKLLLRWPNTRRARIYAGIYYYVLIALIGTVMMGIYVFIETGGHGLAMSRAAISGAVVQTFVLACLLPYLRRRAVLSDDFTLGGLTAGDG